MNTWQDDFGRIEVRRSTSPEGDVIAATTPLAERYATLTQMLDRHAIDSAEKVFLREPTPTGWRDLRYGEASLLTRRLAASLVSLGLGIDRPLAILSGNSIDHALLSLAAMSVGIPVAPISVAYSQFQDLSRLRGILELLSPGLVFAGDGAAFERALSLSAELGAQIAVGAAPPRALNSIELSFLMKNDSGLDCDALRRAVTADTVAKILFTSGSTGTPKGVLVTQRMMCSDQSGMAQVWRFLESEPPVMVDWLPWNHTFGGCLNFNLVLRNGGMMVIDDGRPLPGHIQRSLENLRSHAPTVYLGVPKALNELVKAFASDPALERAFFANIRVIFSAGASLPRATWDALHDGYRRVNGRRLNLFIGWGSTETAPVVSITRPDADRHDSIGLPLPGAAIKLVPNQDKLELRVKGPMVMPGYWRRPDLSAAAFDDDGYYAIGDAGKLDPDRWEQDGILFDGRVAENFKLLSGTWVSVGALRLAAINAAAPLFDEVVVTGHDRDEVGLLVFPSLMACRALAQGDVETLPNLVKLPVVRDAVRKALQQLCGAGGSSMQVRRALLLASAPSMESGEMTDKGYLNQRAALQRRAQDVERLYAEPLHPDVILAADTV